MKFETTKSTADYSRLEVTEWEGVNVADFLLEFSKECPNAWGDINIKPEEGTIIEPLFLRWTANGRPIDAGRHKSFEKGTLPVLSGAYCQAYVVSAYMIDEWGRITLNITARPRRAEDGTPYPRPEKRTQQPDTVRLNPSDVSPKPSAGSPEAFGAKPLGPLTVAQYIDYLRTLDQDRRIWVLYDGYDVLPPIPDACYTPGEFSTGLPDYGVQDGDYLITT